MFRLPTVIYGIALMTVLVLVSGRSISFAQVMQSGSYQIQSDSVNIGGGYSSSTLYRSESTVGEVATGESSSASYALKVGYQQMQSVYISLSSASDILLAPTISGVTGGTSNGSTTVTVVTDSPAGYELTIASTASSSMQGPFGASIADYVPVGNPDYSFILGSTDAVFAYTPEGIDVVSRFKDNGVGLLCNAGVQNGIETCWDGLTTTAESIARKSDANHPQGSTTTIRFRVGIGGSVGQVPGIYTATTTLTAIAL